MWTGPTSQFRVSPSLMIFMGASQHPINIGAPSPIDVPNPASTTSSVIFTAFAADNQINACARTMDKKRGSELDDALKKQHA